MTVQMRIVRRDSDITGITNHVETAIANEGGNITLLCVHVQEKLDTLVRYRLLKITSKLTRVIVHNASRGKRMSDVLQYGLYPLRAALVVTKIAKNLRRC